MRRIAVPVVLACCVLALTASQASAARVEAADGSPTEADVLEAAANYLRLRAEAALEGGSPGQVRKVFSTSQGVTEAYIAEGFRALHEQMGDYPTSSEVTILDAVAELRGDGRASVDMTVQVMTSFSPRSQRSCDEGVVIAHTVDLTVSPNGTYTVASDIYSAEATAAYLSAAEAPVSLVGAARREERRQAQAVAAYEALAARATKTAPTDTSSDGVGISGVAPKYKGVITYDRAAARAYAKKWWNSRNTQQYNNYRDRDCANFVSQCAFAGGMPQFGSGSSAESHKWYFRRSNMTDTQSWRYCPTQVDAWRYQQSGKSPGRYVVKLSTSKPSDYSKGDVAWKVNSGTETHAMICTGFSGSTPLFSCHSSNRWNDPIGTIGSGTNEYGVVADQWVIR